MSDPASTPPAGPAGPGAHGSAASAWARADALDALEEAVLALPGVVGLHGGALGEVATYLPGRRVSGVRVRDGVLEVHVALAYGAPLRATAAAVRGAVRALTPGAVVDVTVEDVVRPDDGTPPARPGP